MKCSIPFALAALAALAAGPQAQCERARILPEGVNQPVGLGSAVAIDAGRLAIATSGTNEIWIYSVEERHAYLDQRISPPRSSPGFGTCIDLSGNLLVVGAPFEGDGAAYVYEDLGAGFVRVARLKAAPSTTGGQFGSSVSIDGERIAVGEPHAGSGVMRRGAVTIFDRQGAAWTRSARLRGESTRENDGFGQSVSLDGNRLAVGAPFLPVGAIQLRAGAVFVFDLVGSKWTESARLVPRTSQTGDGVGVDVDLRGDAVLIGAERSNSAQGELFLFKNQDGSWGETAHIRSETGSFRGFGTSVALSEDARTIVAGSFGEADDTGSVNVYQREDRGWIRARNLVASDSEPDAFFGGAVDMDGNAVVVGAMAANGAYLDAGAAYLFDMSGTLCRSFQASPGSVSIGSGGLQTLFIDAGPANAGAAYVIAGSSDGESPGSMFAGRRVPLNFGTYTSLSLDASRTWITSRTGTLDARGRAVALLNVPAGLAPALAGQILHHAFVLQDGTGTTHVSNVVRLELKP